MNTTSISVEQIHPPIPLAGLGLVDRIALHSGIALIRWVDRSQEHRARRGEARRERSGSTYETARRQAEAEHENARLRSSTLFWNIR